MKDAMSVAGEISLRPARAIEAVKKISDIVPRLDKATALEYEFEINRTSFFEGRDKRTYEKIF